VVNAYRAARKPPGLPFPRQRIGTLYAWLLGAAVIGAVFPPFWFAAGDPGGTARRLREACFDVPLGPFGLLALSVLLPLWLAYEGARAVSGRRVPGARLFALGLSPFFAAALSALPLARRVIGAFASLGDEVGDQLMRIVAGGTAELSSLYAYGDLVSAACLAVVALGAGGAVATIDTRRATPALEPRARTAMLCARAAGAAWALASLVTFVAFVGKRQANATSAFGPLVVCAMAALATAVARRSIALRDWHDEAEARRHTGLLLVTGAAAVLATCLVERGILEDFEARMFGALEGETIDQSVRARVLAGSLPMYRYAGIAVPLDLVLGAATFACALAPGIARGGAPRTTPRFDTSAALTIATLVVLGGVIFAQGDRRARIFASAGGPPAALGDLRLPTVPPAVRARHSRAFARVTIAETGAVQLSIPGRNFVAEHPETGPRMQLYADERLSTGRLIAELAQQRPVCTLFARRGSEADSPGLGELAAVVGAGRLAGFDVQVRREPADIAARLLPGGVLEAWPFHDTARERVVRWERDEIADPYPYFRAKDRPPYVIELTIAPGETVGTLAHALARFELALRDGNQPDRFILVEAEGPASP
jgi:hypothetical protein